MGSRAAKITWPGAIAAVVLGTVLVGVVYGEDGQVGRRCFSAEDLERWQSRSFEGETTYRLGEDPERPGKWVLEANSTGSASAKFLREDIDLRETPIVTWRWRAASMPPVGDERSREGDDFVVRLYVVSEGLGVLLRPLSIAYVWGNAPVGESWRSPFARRQVNVVVDSGEGGSWRTHERNVKEDFLRFHGKRIDSLQGIGLMTDSDGSGATAKGWYDYIEVRARRSRGEREGVCPNDRADVPDPIDSNRRAEHGGRATAVGHER